VDVIGELRKDHREIAARLKELEATSPKASRKRKKLTRQLTDELARHMDIEEQLVFPTAECTDLPKIAFSTPSASLRDMS
jgi:iron-sulfur cluster repair protein YtfE (RIC family)